MRSSRKERGASFSRSTRARTSPPGCSAAVGLDPALGELVLVLLVVLELEQAPLGDRRGTTCATSESSPGAGDLEAVVGGVLAERLDDLRAREASEPSGGARRSGRWRPRAPWPRAAAAGRGARSCRRRARGPPRSGRPAPRRRARSCRRRSSRRSARRCPRAAPARRPAASRRARPTSSLRPSRAASIRMPRKGDEPGEALGPDRRSRCRRRRRRSAAGCGAAAGAAARTSPVALDHELDSLAAASSTSSGGPRTARPLAEAEDPGARPGARRRSRSRTPRRRRPPRSRPRGRSGARTSQSIAVEIQMRAVPTVSPSCQSVRLAYTRGSKSSGRGKSCSALDE